MRGKDFGRGGGKHSILNSTGGAEGVADSAKTGGFNRDSGEGGSRASPKSRGSDSVKGGGSEKRGTEKRKKSEREKKPR